MVSGFRVYRAFVITYTIWGGSFNIATVFSSVHDPSSCVCQDRKSLRLVLRSMACSPGATEKYWKRKAARVSEGVRGLK